MQDSNYFAQRKLCFLRVSPPSLQMRRDFWKEFADFWHHFSLFPALGVCRDSWAPFLAAPSSCEPVHLGDPSTFPATLPSLCEVSLSSCPVLALPSYSVAVSSWILWPSVDRLSESLPALNVYPFCWQTNDMQPKSALKAQCPSRFSLPSAGTTVMTLHIGLICMMGAKMCYLGYGPLHLRKW